MGYPLTSIKLRVTYYSRVSTDHLEQQKSLKNQIEHFDETIRNNKNWIYVQGYVDDGISGTTDYKRDNFMKMINDAKDGKFDLIITKEISRFSRNTLDSIKYTRKLLSYGVAVLFVNDNINTALPDSELRLTIMASMAQDEIRRLSERVKFGMNRAIKNGTILGNDMLYGYKKNRITGNLDIIPQEEKVVKELFSLYAINNYSITKIVKIFNNNEIKTRQNKKWCTSTLSRMLKNPKYKGYYCAKKAEIVDYMTKKVKIIPKDEWILYEDKIKIPPIIDENLWERANNRLNASYKFDDYQNNKILYQNRYPLSAKIYCAIHNEVFHRRKQCKSCNDITWLCAKYLREGKKACDSPNIRESEIYTIFDDILKVLEIKMTNVSNILLELYRSNKKNNDINNKISELMIQRDKIIIKKDKLLELNIEGNLSNSEFNTRNNECNRKLSIIDENIVLLEQSNQNFDENQKKNKKLEKIIHKKIKDSKSKNKLIELLLDRIIVSKINDNKENVELKIYLNFSKSFLEKEAPNLITTKKDYEFKRGYNTTGTRRYTIKYSVSLVVF